MTITISQAVELLMAEVAAEQSATSQKTYEWHARELVKDWGPERPLNDITRLEVQIWLNGHRVNYKPSTLMHKLSCLNRLFRIATDATGNLYQSPVVSIRKPKLNNQRERVLLEIEQVRLRETMGPDPFSVVEFALQTGMRRLEQWRLRPEDIHLWQAEVDPATGTSGSILLGMAHVVTSKTGKGRKVPLNPLAAQIALEWQGRGGKWLFPSDSEDRRLVAAVWFVRKHFHRACKAAGIEGLHWHDLRHTFATRALQGGARPEQISRMLGHSNLAMTQRYMHWSSDLLWPAAMAGFKRPATHDAPALQHPQEPPQLTNLPRQPETQREAKAINWSLRVK